MQNPFFFPIFQSHKMHTKKRSSSCIQSCDYARLGHDHMTFITHAIATYGLWTISSQKSHNTLFKVSHTNTHIPTKEKEMQKHKSTSDIQVTEIFYSQAINPSSISPHFISPYIIPNMYCFLRFNTNLIYKMQKYLSIGIWHNKKEQIKYLTLKDQMRCIDTNELVA